MNEFMVDLKEVSPMLGGMKVNIVGPPRARAELDIVDNGDGTFKVRYKPLSSGNYKMDIKIADTHIPGSPCDIKVIG